jgi:DNA-binding NarL/FixJ family response regulator
MEGGSPSGGNVEPTHSAVLIADDDAAHRRAIRNALEANGFSVVGETGDAAAAISAAERLRPDIVLFEIQLAGEGLAAIRRIARAAPRTLIVVLSRSDRPEDVIAAFAHGASGYLLKGLSGAQLASTLRAADRGEPAVSRALVPHLVDEIRRGSARRVALPGGPVTLTPREWEVAELLREGNSTADIAERLGVSPVTVRRHVSLLLRRLDVTSRQDAVELLREYGRS